MTGNDWESLKSKGDTAVENWIAEQLIGRSCTIVLVGAGTANRKWINHEIAETWNERKGIVGVRVHGLKNLAGFAAPRGGTHFRSCPSPLRVSLSPLWLSFMILLSRTIARLPTTP